MSVRIVPHDSTATIDAIRAFNRRMADKDQTEFYLGENPYHPHPEDVIKEEHFLAVEDDAVRGGLLLVEFPSALSTGVEGIAVNCREPLSEGIIDSKYALLGLTLVKFMQRRAPHLFALGMGGETNAFPRLLKSAGWYVAPVPFLFHVLNANRFLRELQLLKATASKRTLATLAALTGGGKVGITALQYRSLLSAPARRGLTIEPITSWDTWVDDLWQSHRANFSFAVRRDLKTVAALYPLKDRVQAFLIRSQAKPVAWATVLLTPMRNHKYFGNLTVATILDAIAAPHQMQGVVSLVSRAMAQQEADLIVTNQSHVAWVDAFRQSGYTAARSNYTLAMSKQLTADIKAAPGGLEHMHFTRGDSDGRIHL